MKRKNKGFTVIELLVVVGIFFLMTSVLAPFVKMVRERAHIITCGNNLRQISLGLHNYAADNNEAFPTELKALYPNYVESEKTFDCPAAGAIGTAEKPDYKYRAGLTEASAGAETIVEDLDGNHKKAGKNILRINGSVEFVSNR